MDLDNDSVQLSDQVGGTEFFNQPLRFSSFQEFVRSLEFCKPALIYKWLYDDNHHRGYLHQGVLHAFSIPNRYPTVAEYVKSSQEGFEEYPYEDYLVIKEMGYSNPSDFEKVRGTYSLQDWKNIKQIGFENADVFNESLKMDFVFIRLENGNAISFQQFSDMLTSGQGSDFDNLLSLLSGDFGKTQIHMLFREKTESHHYRRGIPYQSGMEGPNNRYQGGSLFSIFELFMNYCDHEGFQNAKKGGFSNRSEYELARNAQCTTKEEWKEFKKTGYKIKQDHLLALKGGFTNPKEYYLALSDEFTDLSEWKQYRSSGFKTKSEYLKAREYGITDRITLRVYEFLRNLELGEQIALSKIQKQTGVDQNALEKIMKGGAISGLGNYNDNIEIFSRQDSKGKKPMFPIHPGERPYEYAVIDGTNVAYGDNEDTPKLNNIIQMYEKLKSLDITPYVCISAALRHRIDDPDELKKWIKKGDWAEAPAGRSDDFFFFQIALEKDAFIVTNDLMRNWKEANPDMAQTIDERRVGYSFMDGSPILDHKAYRMIKRPLE